MQIYELVCIYGSDVNIIESIWGPGVFLSKQIQFVKTNTTHKLEQPNFLITFTVSSEFTVPKILIRLLIFLISWVYQHRICPEDKEPCQVDFKTVFVNSYNRPR